MTPTHSHQDEIDAYMCRHRGVVNAHAHTDLHTRTHWHTQQLMKVIPSQKERAGFPQWLMTHWGNSCGCLCIITCCGVAPLSLHYCRHTLGAPRLLTTGSTGFKITKWKVLTPVCRGTLTSHWVVRHILTSGTRTKGHYIDCSSTVLYNTRLQIS